MKRKPHQKKVSRYKTLWSGKICHIIPDTGPEPPPFKKKTVALNNRLIDPLLNEDVYLVPPPKQDKVKAPVIPIEGRLQTVTTRSKSEELEWEINMMRYWGDSHPAAPSEGEETAYIIRELTLLDTRHHGSTTSLTLSEWEAKGCPVRKRTEKTKAANDDRKFVGPTNIAQSHGVITWTEYLRIKREEKTGLTPSGRPISDFLKGGMYPPAVREKLQTVTPKLPNGTMDGTTMSSFYRNDPGFTPAVKDIQWYINNFQPEDWPDIVTLYTYYSAGAWHVDWEAIAKPFTTARGVTVLSSRKDYEVSLLLKENAGLKEEVLVLMGNDTPCQGTKIKALERELENAEGTISLMNWDMYLHRSKTASATSKATVKTLANQFELFKVQFRDDPLKAFVRLSPYDSRRVGEVREHFDKECNTRIVVSDERRTYRRWANNTEYRKPRRALRVMQEVNDLRRIGCNVALLHSTTVVTELKGLGSRIAPPIYDGDWKKLLQRATVLKAYLSTSKEGYREHELRKTGTYKVLAQGVKLLDKAVGVMNTEVNPFAVKRDKAFAILKAKQQVTKTRRIEALQKKKDHASLLIAALRKHNSGIQ